MTIDKTFDPAAIEARWYARWEETGAFRPARPDAPPFTIVMPPPNVTGSLHIGHALDNTLQDILVRHARLQGKDALWVVGTDHAGIATQMVVERQLALHQQKRTDFSRDEFVGKVWEWKAESGGQITRQLRRLGASCDWSREQFTMDPHFSRAVTHVFVELHRRGLLYRDKRLVNWDPALGTAISDLEVETREVAGKFWHFRYPLADGSGHISVATTRPETMLADMAVAVHPEDARYREMVGRMLRLPITGREIPIIADEHADPELGSGAVKITPGHDFNDFEVGVRTGIKPADMLNMLDAKGAVTQTADGLIPVELIGLDRFAARDRVVALIEAEGALERIEDRVIQVPHGDRSGAVIEPWLTDQWYVDAKTLAGPALEAVRSGAIRMVPETWKKTFYNWLENIQPWCVSRQLWWGHRIPAWNGPGLREDNTLIIGDVIRVTPNWEAVGREPIRQQLFVAETEAEAIEEARRFYPAGVKIRVSDDWQDRGESEADTAVLRRDPDVLDTWFSSALWPFATLGWPGDNPPRNGEGDQPQAGGGGSPRSASPVESPLHRSASGPPPRAGEELLRKHYPNDVLVSGFDILFFWDARMIMQGLEFMREVPFKTLYLHGLVRAPDGSKMSKSKGNTVDPLGLIDRYGADALRFTLGAMESQGRDIKLDERRVEGYRNFATKLWNAARFSQANGIGGSVTLDPPDAKLIHNKWIVGETIKTIQAIDLSLADLRFDEAANTLYHFAWSRFCDWYLELIKPTLLEPDIALQEPIPLAGGGAESPNRQDYDRQRFEKRDTRAVAGWVLDQILVMLHPFMPFITEELWHALAKREADLILARWPNADARAIDAEAGREIDWLIRLVSEIRAARTETNVPPGARTDLVMLETFETSPEGVVLPVPANPMIQLAARHRGALHRLARLDRAIFPGRNVEIDLAKGEQTSCQDRGAEQHALGAQIVVDGATFVLPLESVIDLAAERARLAKAIAAAEKDRDALAARLGNPSFVERAKPEAVEKARADHAERVGEAERLRAALARLG